MADKNPPRRPGQKAHNREDRLKAALKANMARRKAQAQARGAENEANTGPKGSSRESS
tara:strand:- start:1686 stop:1859 length:174 start_codon:yes stop_codon:yes gene_type:complete